MKQSFQTALLINIILLILFVIIDYGVWLRVPLDLSLQDMQGQITDLNVSGQYNVFTRVLSIDGSLTTPSSFEGFQKQSIEINFPLLWVILILCVNLFLIHRKTT
jgi:hypothetical protein